MSSPSRGRRRRFARSCALTGLTTLALLGSSPRAMAESALEIGVGTHFGMGKTEEDPFFSWIRTSGMTSLRDEIYWSDVEKRPGEYALRGRALRTAEVFKRARAAGLRPVLILGYGNPLYDGGGQPTSSAGRSAYAAYAAWLVGTLGEHASYVEIWNEWNLGAGSKPKVQSGSPEDYVALLAAAHASIKGVRPEARVLAGSMGGDGKGWPWLRAAIAAGLLQYADGLSVHLYNHAGPRAGGGVAEFVSRIEELRALLAAHGKADLPIYVTETGWPNHLGPGRISEEEAARRAARLVLELTAMPQVAGVWFYEFMDSGSNRFESEHNFGLLRAGRQEKPIACALRSLVPLLRESRALWSTRAGGIRAAHLQPRQGPSVLALWSEKGGDREQTISVRGRGLELTRSQADCAEISSGPPLARSSKQLKLRLAPFPLVFLLEPGAEVDGLSVEPD